MTTLPLVLDRASRVPLGVQLSDQVRGLVVEGTLPVGTRVPSSRSLARELGTSRTVVEQTYAQLTAEGWLEGRHGSGTYVASAGRLPTANGRVARRPAAGRPLVRLDAGTPYIDERHRAGWRRAWREVSTATPPRGYADPRGLPELRAEIAARLVRTRGLRCDPEQVAITAGTTDGLRHLLGALREGPVGIEDPGYRAAVATADMAGRQVRDLPAAEVATWSLDELAGVYVTPAHQHPLGHVMSASDRLGLLERARRTGSLVIEDDYDSEFRYDVAPIPALASLDAASVAYLGTAAKSVGPSIRIGWLVAPEPVTTRLAQRREATHDAVPWPVQRAFVALLRDGYVDAVVRSARRVYAERSAKVTAALSGFATPSAASPAGMYATWLMPQERAERAQEEALAAGYEVNLLSRYRRSSRLTGLVVGFGGVTDAELDGALEALVRGLEAS